VDIPGPAGVLQAQFDEAAEAAGPVALLCHPHPQYGGSMHDAVLQTCADVLLSQGVHCLRFNFRGVGGSSGRYDNGAGEAEDVLAAAAWLRNHHAEHPQWWLGYSFGAAMVWRALGLEQQTPARAVLIAPPVGMLDFSGAHSGLSIDAIAGDRDDFVDTGRLQQLSGVTAHIIGGADHFFAGSHDQLAQTLAGIIR